MTDQKIHIDGLVISRWSRELFEDMRAGGVTAANCTCAIWEDFRGGMANLAAWKQMFRENADLILQVNTTADIRRAAEIDRTGIILGWQNTSPIENDVSNLALFYELGVRVMQLTYNTRNLTGSGCHETRDAGLSDFGREMVAEMNRLGILIDLSHVGPVTSAETIAASERPVAYTHCCPTLKAHPRNKTDDQLREIAARDGFVGFASYTPFLPKGADSTLDDCAAAMEYVIDLVGEERVGIGTDWVQGQDKAFFDYLGRDHGVGRQLYPPYEKVPPPVQGLERLRDFGNFIPAMEARNWTATRIERVMGLNWLNFLDEVW
ncbi:MAG: peptidase M19 [Rhodospirillaceae bacterium]|jgi:membrane dipeptidase|nr:peptidase M19 [Rhodospirillaceae bacterium]MBT6138208.1 peptidase M19 [Rhodospirillaceae bacterium]